MDGQMKQYDVIVIGGGPGGYRTAELLGKRRLHVALIEEASLGGVCLNEGCIPFKSYLHAANVMREALTLGGEGLLRSADGLQLEQNQVFQKKSAIVDALRRSVSAALQSCGVTVVHGKAHVADCGEKQITVEAEGEQFVCDTLVIATGSQSAPRDAVPAGAAYRVIGSRELLQMDSLPSAMDILGAGAVGLEAACYLANAGCEVTVLEEAERIGGRIDAEISDALCRILRKRGVNILTGARVAQFGTDGITVVQNGVSSLRNPQYLLYAAGRKPRLDTADLDRLGVRYQPAGIEVDEQCRTSNPHVFACGDVIGRLMLAHTAYRQAKVIADTVCGVDAAMDYRFIPRVIYTSPEVMSVGLSEQECIDAGIDYTARSLPMTYSGKYYAEHGRDGAKAKMIVDGDGRVLGLHMIAHGASELSLAVELMCMRQMTAAQIADLVFAHPTYGEIISDLAACFDQ